MLVRGLDKRWLNKQIVESPEVSQVVTLDVELTATNFAEVWLFTGVCACMYLQWRLWLQDLQPIHVKHLSNKKSVEGRSTNIPNSPYKNFSQSSLYLYLALQHKFSLSSLPISWATSGLDPRPNWNRLTNRCLSKK